MIIRQVQECDKRQLCILLNEAFHSNPLINYNNDEKFRRFLMTPNQYTFVGFYDNKLVATHTVTIEHKLLYNYGKVAHMEDLAVLKEYRGKGFAKRMLEYSLEFCKQQGVYKILATCEPNMVKYYGDIVGFKEHEISLRRDL
jgi:ribosomal protein S18 acetylase RimI-like enzyme